MARGARRSDRECAECRHVLVARRFGPERVGARGARLVAAVGRLQVDALRAAIAADEAGGRKPLVVVANAGTTATGAVDPFHELSQVCLERGIWLHVDGAYGAFACLTERGRQTLAGMELADSITLDPHKWLYQPVELGALLVRDGSALQRGFEISPDFLKDVEATDREVNFSDFGLQLTRSCRALKLWISLRYFGVSAFRAAIDTCLDLALHAQGRIESSPELELMSPASLGVVTFRRHPSGVDDEAILERLNASIAERIERGGEVFISTGRVRGRYVLRLCILNHSTSQAEVDRASELAATLPVDAAPGPPTMKRESYPAIDAGWVGRSSLDADAMRSVTLFASLDGDQAERVLRAAHEHHALTGEAIVQQWQVSRDLYVVLTGAVAIHVEGDLVRTPGPGEFFGELAAIDWGAGFGRTRSALPQRDYEAQVRVIQVAVERDRAGCEPDARGGRIDARPAGDDTRVELDDALAGGNLDEVEVASSVPSASRKVAVPVASTWPGVSSENVAKQNSNEPIGAPFGVSIASSARKSGHSAVGPRKSGEAVARTAIAPGPGQGGTRRGEQCRTSSRSQPPPERGAPSRSACRDDCNQAEAWLPTHCRPVPRLPGRGDPARAACARSPRCASRRQRLSRCWLAQSRTRAAWTVALSRPPAASRTHARS
jgi:hypothetical protein